MDKVKIKNYPVGPFPVVIAGVEVDGRPNYVTVGATGVVCLEPILYISLKSDHYSTRGVHENGFFSVNIPSADMVQKTDYCGIVSGNTTDKSGVFTPFYDAIGRAPLIAECALNFLCTVIKSIPVSGFEMFLGEIVAAYGNESCLSEGKPDPAKIDPMMLLGTSYCGVGRVLGKVFREGKKRGDPQAAP
jgi:flavin reductase (DIM6/NTAB) family NADH-FMN oxidoreductase RutF